MLSLFDLGVSYRLNSWWQYPAAQMAARFRRQAFVLTLGLSEPPGLSFRQMCACVQVHWVAAGWSLAVPVASGSDGSGVSVKRARRMVTGASWAIRL